MTTEKNKVPWIEPDPETIRHHKEALQTPSFIKELKEYQLQRLLLYSVRRLTDLRKEVREIKQRDEYKDIDTAEMEQGRLIELEKALQTRIGNRLDRYSQSDQQEDNLPDPGSVAETFYNNPNNKRKKFTPQKIAPVMEATREYIINKEIKDIDGHVNSIVDEKRFEGSPNTQRKWIKFYAERAFTHK